MVGEWASEHLNSGHASRNFHRVNKHIRCLSRLRLFSISERRHDLIYCVICRFNSFHFKWTPMDNVVPCRWWYMKQTHVCGLGNENNPLATLNIREKKETLYFRSHEINEERCWFDYASVFELCIWFIIVQRKRERKNQTNINDTFMTSNLNALYSRCGCVGEHTHAFVWTVGLLAPHKSSTFSFKGRNVVCLYYIYILINYYCCVKYQTKM